MHEIKLRPHHGLCIRFFTGKGYSEKFVENMYRVIDMLRRDDPEITLTVSSDIICSSCPNLIDGICGDKAGSYDRSVLSLCGLRDGEIIKWSDFYAKTDREIVRKGLLSSVCANCQWQYICSGLAKSLAQKLF